MWWSAKKILFYTNIYLYEFYLYYLYMSLTQLNAIFNFWFLGVAYYSFTIILYKLYLILLSIDYYCVNCEKLHNEFTFKKKVLIATYI